MGFVRIKGLIPTDHVLRKIYKAMDCIFIREKIRNHYCTDNDSPSIDPVILSKCPQAHLDLENRKPRSKGRVSCFFISQMMHLLLLESVITH
jgi:hypothetical protein